MKTLSRPSPPKIKESYPHWVCAPCGISANVLTCLEKYGKRPNELKSTISTYHPGVCDVCKEERDVTEARDFFYPKFELLDRNFIRIKREKSNDSF